MSHSDLLIEKIVQHRVQTDSLAAADALLRHLTDWQIQRVRGPLVTFTLLPAHQNLNAKGSHG